jgi:histidinol phosphatase-like enzyme
MDREIVLIMGYPAAGKSRLVAGLVSHGFFDINPNNKPYPLEEKLLLICEAFCMGRQKIVLDDPCLTVAERLSLVSLAKSLRVPIRCFWLKTSFEDSQLNLCLKMAKETGNILNPEDFKNQSKFLSPSDLISAKEKFSDEQFPKASEGFSEVEEMEFKRVWGEEYKNKALILDFDDTLRKSIGPKNWPEKPEHVQILPKRTEVLKKYAENGFLLLGASNQSAIAKGLPETDCIACFEETLRQLGVKVEYLYCRHKVPPLQCYCRKPEAGIGAFWIEKYKLNPSECIMVGDATSDRLFAERCGFQYQHPDQFFN